MESIRGPGEVWGGWPPASLFMNPYFPFLLTLPLQYFPLLGTQGIPVGARDLPPHIFLLLVCPSAA